jgi:SAM-dependent methyltransferase
MRNASSDPEIDAAAFDRIYLASDDPRAQSGYGGSAARWEAARRAIVEGVNSAGTFLDVGCANGLLMESVLAWTPLPLEVAGVDFAPGLVGLARQRLPRWRDRIWLADVAMWEPSETFDFVHVRLDTGYIERVARWGRRLIVSSDGSFRRAESPRAENVGACLRAMGLPVSGEVYRRSDEHLCELSVAWCDRR